MEFAVSEEVTTRRAETKGGTVRGKPSPRTRFLSLLRQMNSMLEDYPKVLRPPAGRDFEHVREMVGDVAERLAAVFGLGRVGGRKAE